jgi:hypothetical protein
MSRHFRQLSVDVLERPQLGDVKDKYDAVSSFVNVDKFSVERRFDHLLSVVAGSELESVHLFPLLALVDDVPDFDLDNVVSRFVVPLNGGHLDLIRRNVFFGKFSSLECKI